MMFIRENNSLIINPPEELTIRTVSDFVEAIKPELRDYETLLINLVGVIEIDSAGFQTILALKNETLEQKKNFSIIGMSMDVDELVSLYQADTYLNS